MRVKSNFAKTIRLAVVSVVAVLVFLAGVTAQASDGGSNYRRVVTIYDQGERKSIITRAATVERALEAAKIDVLEGDKVEPKPDTKLDGNEFVINIYRSWPVMIVDGMKRERVLSIHSNPQDILKQAGVNIRPEDKISLELATNIMTDGVGANLNITRAIRVNMVLYGNPKVVYTQAKTVDDLLKEKGVNLGSDDTVSVDRATKISADMMVEVWRNGVQTITEDKEIPFTTKTVNDPNKESSYKEVTTKGKNGKRTITYQVTMRNGQELERKEIQNVVTEEPVEQVEVIGSKFNYTGGPLNDTQITALGNCESGMTATRNSGNGYYGAFQFSGSTWRSSAPAEYKNVLPHQAPLEAQKQAVQNLLSRSSIYTQFPGCAIKMSAQGLL